MSLAHAEDIHTPPVTIHALPNDIFREIFREVLAFYISEPCPYRHVCGIRNAKHHAMAWQSLVHVCQGWRNIIYESPRYLDLHIHCSGETPFRKNFSRWPEFPLTLNYNVYPEEPGELEYDDDVLFALKHRDRVHRIDLNINFAPHEVLLSTMQVPFPVLTHLELTGPEGEGSEEFSLPDQFLGGSAPLLQHIHFSMISFPALPEFLSSARSLVCLELWNIPAHDYISPEAMIRALSGLTKLTNLSIEFIFAHEDTSSSDDGPGKRGRWDPSLRAALPALICFEFAGGNAYLEALIAQIDTPQVEVVEVAYRMPEADICQLSQFIGRSTNLESAQFKHSHVNFHEHDAVIELYGSQCEFHEARLSLTIAIEGDCYHMLRILGQLAANLSNVNNLSVETGRYWTENGDRTETFQWLSFLHLFPAVRALRISGGLAINIASTLESIAEETVAEVLPALRLLHLGNGHEPVGSTERFLALRVLSDRPVAVVNTQAWIKE